MASDVKQQKLQPLVIELLGVVNKVVQDGRKPIVEQDGFHHLISYLEELQPLLTKFQNMMINELPLGLRVPEDLEAICSALEMESRSEKTAVGITTSDKNKAMQKGLVMDLSCLLGVLDFNKNSKPLSEQLRLVHKELVDCTHPSEKELVD
ncbi:unnamed protein product [Sphagnum balticum]